MSSRTAQSVRRFMPAWVLLIARTGAVFICLRTSFSSELSILSAGGGVSLVSGSLSAFVSLKTPKKST